MHLSWRDVPPGPGCPPVPTSLLAEEAAELGRLAAGRRVLEIGSAYGYSACVMALAGGEVTAVDPHGPPPYDFWDAMTSNLAACRVTGRVTIVRERSQQALPCLFAQKQRFGLVFIDANHEPDEVRHDILGSLALLEPGGTLALHDHLETCCCPGVAQGAAGVLPPDCPAVGSMLLFTAAA